MGVERLHMLVVTKTPVDGEVSVALALAVIGRYSAAWLLARLSGARQRELAALLLTVFQA